MRCCFSEYDKTPIRTGHLKMGGKDHEGHEIAANSRYFTKDGKPFIAVMGEYHFVRDNRENWYRELCKMKAGGISIAASYVFWIYHEEDEGKFDFSGDRDLRTFVLTCQKAGLSMFLRIGPWAHGECRNGGFPDWLLKKGCEIRDDDETYLMYVRRYYTAVYHEVHDLFYKDGGPIIGLQIENELPGRPHHLKTLKSLALEIGFDLPIYTVTGWSGAYGTKMPVDEFVPVFGGYPEAPWEDHISELSPSEHFLFSAKRNDSAIGVDILKDVAEDGWRLPYEDYPFATCEIGGGNEVTHHRRPIIRPMDVYAISLCLLGSGNNLIGYYMYHGGVNKIGKYSTLSETKATGYPNDYAYLSYDFQAPISQYGELREHYRILNLLHLFVAAYGDILAPLCFTSSEATVSADDFRSLRYAMRTNGKTGFIFVNHHVRLHPMEDVHGAVFAPCGLEFPPIDVKGDIAFFMPFGLPLNGSILTYATAQPVTIVGDTYVFAGIPGIEPVFAFDGAAPFTAEFGKVTPIGCGRLLVLSPEDARFVRVLSGKVYIGDGADLYEYDGEITSDADGDYSYRLYNGTDLETVCVKAKKASAQALVTRTPLDAAPFELPYADELSIGGKRMITYEAIAVSSPDGMIEIPDACDVEQLYADGVLVADRYYHGEPWRVPASLLYGHTCYLVYSEMKDDFYREF